MAIRTGNDIRDGDVSLLELANTRRTDVEMKTPSPFLKYAARVAGPLALLVLLSGAWVSKVWRDARVAANLTPEEVVSAFQDAGFEVKGLKDISYYPGPMTRGEGVEFYTHARDETFHVIVVMYTSNEKAKDVATEINALNQRMQGGYASALHRGPIVVEIYPSERTVTRRLESALKKME